jgi:hypothetical protein
MIYYLFDIHCFHWIRPIHTDTYDGVPINECVIQRILAIARRMHHLIHRFQAEYGDNAYSMFMPNPCNTVLHFLIGYLNSVHLHDMFKFFFKLLVNAAKRQILVRGQVQVLLNKMDEKCSAIPDGLRMSLHKLADGIWQPQHHQYLSSSFPDYTVARETSEIHDLSDLLAAYTSLQIDPHGTVDDSASGQPR